MTAAKAATSALLTSLLLTSSPVTQAQSQSPAAPDTPRADQRLPVRRVVLYKSGVGYFEHLGKVRDAQNVTIDFTSGQLNDVLKSLTTLDLGGGRVTNVNFNSTAALERRLAALRLPLGQQATRAQLLNALRGARIDVGSATARIAGRLLSVERVERRRDASTSTSVDAVTIVTDAGDVQQIALDSGVTVRIVESGLNQEVAQYLSLVASERDQDLRQLTLATSGAGERDLFVSYISEVPVWKATYRLVLPATGEARQPLLQGWAIVDNTVGADWNNVELSLVAGAPQSFVQDISRPYYVQRPVVPVAERMLMTPQTFQAGLTTAGGGSISGVLTDPSGATLPGVTVTASWNGKRIATAVSDDRGRYRLTGLPAAQYVVEAELSSFRKVSRTVTVSGGADTIMNAKMDIGAMTEEMTVSAASRFRSTTTGGSGSGRGNAWALENGAADVTDALLDTRVDAARAAMQSEALAAQLGDLFEYKLKERVTLKKNQSALVPILSGNVTAEKVSVWNATSGGRPQRAIWMTNSTGLTLDGGTFSIVEGNAFAGEGLIEPLKAGARRLLSYALDLGFQVSAAGDLLPTPVTKITVNRGVLVQTNAARESRSYTARNEDTEARTLIIEHPARSGWVLGGAIKPEESTASWHRFRVVVAPKATSTFTVDETRQFSTQVQITDIESDHIAAYIHDKVISPQLEAALQEVVRRKAAIALLNTQGEAREGEESQINHDQERLRENMKALKGSGEEKALLQRYVKQLDEQENRLEALRKEIKALEEQIAKAETELAAYILTISG